MRKLLLGSLFFALIQGPGAAAQTQTPVDQLAKPPATATHYIIQSTGSKHGDSYIWTAADGTRMGRESFNLRGQVFEFDSAGKAGKDGMPASIVIRGQSPQGNAAENFSVEGGKASWKSPVDAGSTAYQSPAFTRHRADRSSRPHGSSNVCWHRRTAR